MEVKDVTAFQSSLPRRQVIFALAGTMMAMFLNSLYMTVVATAMPRVITDLGGFSQYTWVFTSFFIAEVVTIPLTGKLSDKYGRKWFYISCLIIFVTGSLLSGVSQSMTQLIIFRGLQGIGGGAMMSLSFIVIGDLFTPAERGKYVGLMSGVMVISTIIGPTLGGYLTDYLSWRWCFFINVPIGVIVIFLFIFFYPQLRAGDTKSKLDYAGIATMILAIVPLTLVLTWGGVDYRWLSPIIIGLLGFSLVVFLLFFIIESHAEDPIVTLQLFKVRVVAVSSINSFLMGATFMPSVTFVPLYLQGVLGATAIQSGNSQVPMMLSAAVSSFIGGQVISRAGGYYRLLGAIGFVITAVGFLLLSRMTAEVSYVNFIINIIVVGFGTGFIMPVYTLAVQNTVPYAVMGTATALVNWFRTIGGLFGLSMVGSILNNRFGSEFMGNLSPEIKEVVSPEKLASIVDNPQALVNIEARAELESLFEGLGAQGKALFEQMLSTLQNALNSAVTEVFTVVFGVTILSMIIHLFLKGIPPHKLTRDTTVT